MDLNSMFGTSGDKGKFDPIGEITLKTPMYW